MDHKPETRAPEIGGDSIEVDQTPPDDTKAIRRIIYRCDLRLLPPLFLVWFFPFIDRVNFGNARIQGLEKDLHMTGNQFNIALVVFFVPLILVEAPFNIGLKMASPALWIGASVLLLGQYINVSQRSYE